MFLIAHSGYCIPSFSYLLSFQDEYELATCQQLHVPCCCTASALPGCQQVVAPGPVPGHLSGYQTPQCWGQGVCYTGSCRVHGTELGLCLCQSSAGCQQQRLAGWPLSLPSWLVWPMHDHTVSVRKFCLFKRSAMGSSDAHYHLPGSHA